MMKPRTDDIWEHKKNGSRVIVRKLWTLNKEMDMVEVFDTREKSWYNMTVNGFVFLYNFIDNDQKRSATNGYKFWFIGKVLKGWLC